jgi:tetratricopeptide (TPR) repeat protein
VCGLLLFVDSLMLVSASPTRDLICAVAFEIAMLAMVALIRLRPARVRADKAKSVILDQVESEWPVLKHLRKAAQALSVAGLALTATILAGETIGMSAAFAGNYPIAEWAYCNLPTARLLGFHPAYSLEILTGAYIGVGKYAQAEPAYPHILAIREKLYGQKHVYIPGFYADLADLRVRQNRLDEAESAYKKALELSRWVQGDWGAGRVYTRLGDLLTRQDKFPEAEEAYKNALSMRTKQFGPRSLKVAETLHSYNYLLEREGRSSEASAMKDEEKNILKREAPDTTYSAATPVAMIGISFVLSYLMFGRNGFLTNRAIKRLEESPQEKGADALDILKNFKNKR